MKAVADRVLRSFALVVTDRRWAAPLSAMALGFGVFVGVAVGPSAEGTLAGAAQIIEMPTSDGEDRPAPKAGAVGSTAARDGIRRSTAGEAGGLALGPAPEPVAPLVPAPEEPPVAEDPRPDPDPPPAEPTAEDEEESELKGVVAHVNPAAGSYALAIAGGELVSLHARRLPAPGSRLTALARRLANGTFAEAKSPRRRGKAARVDFRGVVTFVDPDPVAPAYTVSGRGASLLIHVPADPSGGAPQLPALGAYVTVTAAIERDATSAEPVALSQLDVEVEAGEPATYLDLAGIVSAVLPETSQLLISADDIGQSGKDIALTVPLEIDLGKVASGDSYLVTATVGEDGSLTLAGLVSDEHRKGADDPTTAQGDLKHP